ncbi:MAG TPA: alpha/beta hydrolase [Nocardioides sp.]|nr:alpha/beta hydrolase [Nocardioides sp.]
MAVIALPARVGPFRQLLSTPGAARDLATDLRAVTTDVKEVQAWAERTSGGAWTGEAEASAHHARTRFAVRLDAGEAALEHAVVAADRFEDRLRRLQLQRTDLETERLTLDRDIEHLRAVIGAAGAGADVAALRRDAERLRHRAEVLVGDIADWETRCDEAEDDFVAALRAVDTLAEGRDAAGDPDRPEPQSLLLDLNSRAQDPAAVAAWWRGLTRAQREALVTEFPHVVGNTDGVPVADRDEANRAYLLGRLDHLGEREADCQLTDDERSELTKARRLADLLDDYGNRVDPGTGDNLLNLVGYRPDSYSGDGGVILSLGNPDTAEHVAAYVPGTTSEGGDLSGLDRVETLYDDMLAEGRGSVASVLWLDYDAPSADSLTDLDELGDVGSVVSTGDAQDGGRRLSDFIDGLHATDRGAPEDLTVIGHSYGATTVGYAAHDGAGLDQLVLLGSPGEPTATADALTGADVFVGAADYDPVSLLGLGERGGVGALGYDPAQADFGATRFDVDPGSYRVEDLLHNHTSYFEGTSLDNITDIATGGDPTVDDGRSASGDGFYQNLSELLAGSSTASGGDWLWSQAHDVAEGIGRSLLDLAHPHY